MREIRISHPLAEVHIKPLGHHKMSDLKASIEQILDGYIEHEDDVVPFSDLKHKMKARHGEAYQTPAYYLALYRHRAGSTQAILAEKLHIKQHHISEMENHKRAIGPALAKRLAKVLKCDYRKFL